MPEEKKHASTARVVALLTDIVEHPARYKFVMGMPGRFDAAEYLYDHHWEELPADVADKVEGVLLASGKYHLKDQNN